MSKYIVAIDQSTTNSRCILFDHMGNTVSSDQKEHRLIYPREDCVEHDPMEIWINVQEVCKNALQQSGLSPVHIAAIGIANQRETTVIWNRKTGQPYYNALVCQDTRSNQICERLSQEGGRDRFRSKTGLPINAYFSATKIMWLLDNVAGLRKAAQCGDALFGTIDSWLVWNLTGGINRGVHATDVTNASRTMLMNINSLEWDADIISELDIPPAMLPSIYPSSTFYGRATGVFENVPICSALGDQQAALFGQTCYEVGAAKNSYSTGCFMLLNTGRTPVTSASGLLTTVGYKIGRQPAIYCLEGAISIAGALVQWLRDNLGLLGEFEDIETLARNVPDNGGMYLVPAFSGLYAPYWRSNARGVMVGLSHYIRREHIARAVLESVVYQARDIFEAMYQDTGFRPSFLRVDGGISHDDLLMQFQADILDVPVYRSRWSDTIALGAAYAAGLAVDYWDSLNELKVNWEISKKWLPQMDDGTRERLYSGWKKAVTRTFDWVD